jgi:ribosomal protein L11 methylase PrmA
MKNNSTALESSRSVDDTSPQPLTSSFRDPSGFVFRHQGTIYRQVNRSAAASYDQLMQSGLYGTLAEAALLIRHAEVPRRIGDSRVHRILRPEPIRFVSYPYEWCFSQLKAAAFTTLDVQRRALQYGMSLKDCSAYNIQFQGCRPVLIDTLSFEPYREGEPWVAYRQFCQHFLAPLALMSRRDIRFSRIGRINIDGIPLDFASKLLPMRTWLNPRLLLHLHLHASAIRRFSGSTPATSKGKMPRPALLALIDNLSAAVDALTWRPERSAWVDYEQETNYSAAAHTSKEQIVHQMLTDIRPRMLWDLGANAGRFGRMAARLGAYAVAFDGDDGATEMNYRACRHAGENNILPLVLDLTNPSPALGWEHAERLSWRQRSPADVALALALVHHLAIGNNVPLTKLAALFAGITPHLIVEFVPKSDSQVQRLLATREDVFSDYSREGFEGAFSRMFDIIRAVPVDNSERVIYLMRTRQQRT